MKNKKRLLLLIIFILLCLFVLSIVQIYAKYISSATGNSTMKVARWDIKVNNLSIKDSTNISNLIVPVFPGNPNISQGIIAPTAEGYFDLNLDFSNADVSFKYLIETSADKSSSISDIVATRIFDRWWAKN